MWLLLPLRTLSSLLGLGNRQSAPTDRSPLGALGQGCCPDTARAYMPSLGRREGLT
jgi:hypothetical protein